jgi:hypothetical protein
LRLWGSLIDASSPSSRCHIAFLLVMRFSTEPTSCWEDGSQEADS